MRGGLHPERRQGRIALFGVWLASSVSAGPQPEAGGAAKLPARLEQIAVIRVYGSILYSTGQWGGVPGTTPTPLTRQHIDHWMRSCAEAGVTTVLWRANCAGTLTYPSRLSALAGEPPLPDPNEGMGVASVKQGWPDADWRWLGEQCARFDTLAAAVESAHGHGLRIYLDFHTFDMVGSWCTQRTWPQGADRAWDEDLWLWSRDQRRRLAGVPCYADPRVRARRLAEIAEALAYDLDGVALGFFSHCDGMAGEERCAFGYNPVVADAYRARHGTDPRTEPVDPHRFYALHGEGYTQFVREASSLVRGRHRKLLASTRTDGVHGWGGQSAGGGLVGATMASADLRDGHSDLALAGGFYLETERWAREQLVDGLLCSAPFADGVGAARALKERTGIPVHLWRKYTGYKGSVSAPGLDVYRGEILAVRAGALDGYCMLVMQITDHPWFKPDWRDLYRP